MAIARMRQAGAVLMLAGVLVLASCKEKEAGTGAGGTKAGEPVAIAAVAATATATVEAVDPEARTVTLRKPDDTTVAYKVGKDVANFDEIQPGDQVKVKVIDAMAVYVRKAGTQPSAVERDMVALTPRGAKPETVMARTMEITDKIEAVDSANKTITLQGAAGKPLTMKVGPNVNLSRFEKGDDVVVRHTEALVVEVEKPQTSEE